MPNSVSFEHHDRRQFVELREEDHVVRTTSPERISRLLPVPSESVPPEPQKHEEKPKPKILNVSIPPATGSSSLPTPVSISQTTPPPTGPAPVLHIGDIITEASVSDIDSHSVGEHDGALKLELLRTLGQGAFSSVWLAKDVSGRVGSLEIVRRSSLRRSMSKSSLNKGSLRRKKGSVRRKIEGAVPKVLLGDGKSFGEGERLGSHNDLNEWFKEKEEGLGRGRVDEAREKKAGMGRVVALKMTDRSLCDRDDRTRVSFVREVEVLKVGLRCCCVLTILTAS